MSKVVRTTKAGEPSFTLGIDIMKENDAYIPYYLFRSDLKEALEEYDSRLHRDVNYYSDFFGITRKWNALLKQGKTQRGKKFLQIGCKRFVGENRTRLIRWANGK